MYYTPFFYIGNRKDTQRGRLTEFHNNAFSGETPKIPVRRQHGTAGNGQVFRASQKAPEDRPNPGGYGFFSVLSAGDGLANGNFYMIFSFSSGRNTGQYICSLSEIALQAAIIVGSVFPDFFFNTIIYGGTHIPCPAVFDAVQVVAVLFHQSHTIFRVAEQRLSRSLAKDI